MKNHRLIVPLRKLLNKGKSLVFLYGMKKDEIYYYDYIKGIVNEKDTFKYATLFSNTDEILFSDYYIQIDSIEIKVFTKRENFIEEVTDKFLSGDNLDHKLNNLEKKLRNLDKKCFIYIHNFDWLSELYSPTKDRTLKIIKFIKTWSEIKDTKVVVNVVNIDLLNDYNLDIESSIYIGNPSAKEIQKMYLRIFLSETSKVNLKMTDLFNTLSEISYIISSSNKSLKEARRIYNNIVKHNQNYDLNKKDFTDATEKILDEKITFDDVILKDETKDKILSAVDSFLNSIKKEDRNARKGIILTGPPGTGKTFIVKAIANERDCFFLAPTLADLKGEYIGHTSAKVKRIFEKARANEPTILFIDEADTVFTDRNSKEDNDSFLTDMVNQFLVEIDGMTTGRQKVFIIAATNRIESIDPAIRSRLSENITVGLPGFNERKELFHKKLLKYNFLFKEKSFQDEICKKTENMSGRDIDNFVKKLYEKVVIKGKYDNLSLLKDDTDTKNIFLEVLEDIEEELVHELRRKLKIEIKTPKEIETEIEDIIGYENLKNKILDSIRFLNETNEEKKIKRLFGIENQYGSILYGSSGNGKTKLVEAIAKKENLYYIRVLSKDFISNFRNDILEKINLIFEESKRLAKMTSLRKGILLFFDEFDSLAATNVLTNEVKGTLLDYLGKDNEGGLRNEESKIVFFAATNHYDNIDEAIKRKGRIDIHVEFLNPTEKEGKRILQKKITNDKYIKNIDNNLIDDIYSRIKANKKIKLENIYKDVALTPNELNPSGSEIVDALKEIKRKSFNMKKISNNQLIIDNEVINDFFKIYTNNM